MSGVLGQRLARDESAGAALASARQAARTPSYARALRDWRTPEDLAEWAAPHFRFDAERALQLSATNRQVATPPAIAEPAAFFDAPSGVCLDLARFAVETLRQIDPQAQARYLMIEFEPVTVDGHTLRLHWIASFRRGGRLYFFADSERAGHIAGPYATAQAFIDGYAAYRGRPVVRFLELDSLQRQPQAPAPR
jgi:hypothetical protein